MARIAVIAYFFPPVSQVGYKRPLRFAKYLKSRGHEITIYGVHPRTPELRNYTGLDPGLLKQVDPEFRVVRTPSIHLFKILLGMRNRLRGGAGAAPTVGSGKAPSLSPSVAGSSAPKPSLKQRLIDGFMGAFEVPDPYWGWILTTLPALLWNSLLRRPEAIYVTGPPWSPLILATLAGRLLRIPVHLDFRDPWNTNTYWKAKKLSLLLERWVMARAATVISNTSSMTESFLKVHPGLRGKLFTVYNGYEASTRSRMEALRSLRLDRPKDRFTVSHIGLLYPNRMPPELARLLAEAAAAWTGPRALRIRFVGIVMDPAPLHREFAARGLSDVLEFIGEVDTATAQAEEAKADVLMLLQSGTKEQIPAKVFEYVFTGNPILCVADEGSETGGLVSRYGLGRVFTGREAPEDILAFLRDSQDGATGAIGSIGSEPPAEFLRDFDGDGLSEKLRAAVFRPPA